MNAMFHAWWAAHTLEFVLFGLLLVIVALMGVVKVIIWAIRHWLAKHT